MFKCDTLLGTECFWYWMVYQHHNANRLLNAYSSKFVTKTRGYSVTVSTTALTPHCTDCSDVLSFSLLLPLLLLPPSFFLIAMVCYCICDALAPLTEREPGRAELLHLSVQWGSAGSWRGLRSWEGRSCNVGWARRRAPSCCSLLQGITFSQASDHLEKKH